MIIIKLILGSVGFGFIAWLNLNLFEKLLNTEDFAKFVVVGEMIVLISTLFESAYTNIYVLHNKGEIREHLIQRLFFSLLLYFLFLVFVNFIYDYTYSYFLILALGFFILQVFSSTFMLDLQKKEMFVLYSLTKNTSHLIKLVCIGCILYIDDLNNDAVFLILSILSIPVILYYVLNRELFTFVKSENFIKNNIPDISKFTILSISSILLTKVDLFMLAALSTSQQVAIFVICFSYIKLFSILISSLNTYLLKYAAELSTRYLFRLFVRKSIFISSIFVMFLVIFLWLFPFVAEFVGYQFSAHVYVGVLEVLVFASVLEIIFIPLIIICTKFNKLNELMFFNVVCLICNVIANFVLIPQHGAVGAAISTLVVRVFGAAAVSFIVIKQYSQLNEKNN